MNVLSLFDGMSCGQIALKRSDIKVDKYYASEIDRFAIETTQKNFPNTIQLGSVTEIIAKDLPKIDLLIGGSPCQGFSREGKHLNFEDPRSKLFFEFVRLLKETKPKYFLLENVKMKKEWRDLISEYLGVEPIEINSNLMSAQNRSRYYWTNIKNIKQPVDKNIYLKDILQENISDIKYKISDTYLEQFKKYQSHNQTQISFTEQRTEEAKRIRREYRQLHGKDYNPRRSKEIVPRKDNKSNCLTTSLNREHIVLDEKFNLRKLTPIECERLQTVDDNYTEGVSNTQRYRMLGNGWTVDTIAHIFKNIK